jgi:hypothetical protein
MADPALATPGLAQSVSDLETDLNAIDVDGFEALLPRVIAEDLAALSVSNRLFSDSPQRCKKFKFVRSAVEPTFERTPSVDKFRRAGFRLHKQASGILLPDQLLLAVNDNYATPWARVGPRRIVKKILDTVNKATDAELAFVHKDGHRAKAGSAVRLYWIMPEIHLFRLLNLVRSTNSWRPPVPRPAKNVW